MALSGVTYPSDGVTKEYTLAFALGYISEDHITAWVDGEYSSDGSKAYRALTFLSRERVRLEGAVPPAGTLIEFERVVPKTRELIEYSNGDALNEDNLDTAQKQALMGVHEALDGVFGVNARITREVSTLNGRIDRETEELRSEMNGLAEQVIFIFVEKEPGSDTNPVVRRDYVHTQEAAEAVWIINHDLDTYPSVSVYDHTGQFLAVEHSYSTKNQMRITFAQPERGVAYVH